MTPGCKICGGAAAPVFSVDFHHNSSRKLGFVQEPLSPSGDKVVYERCAGCGFLFTRLMDAWSPGEISARVYNADFPVLDGGYNGQRAGAMANALCVALGPEFKNVKMLDYGSGKGLCAMLVNAQSGSMRSYDPFAGAFRPDSLFQLIVAQEVVEHCINPREAAADMLSLLQPGGILLLTTDLLPETYGPDWWYICPRVGHVSLHTFSSLSKLFAPYRVRTISAGIHVVYDTWPAWAKGLWHD